MAISIGTNRKSRRSAQNIRNNTGSVLVLGLAMLIIIATCITFGMLFTTFIPTMGQQHAILQGACAEAVLACDNATYSLGELRPDAPRDRRAYIEDAVRKILLREGVDSSVHIDIAQSNMKQKERVEPSLNVHVKGSLFFRRNAPFVLGTVAVDTTYNILEYYLPECIVEVVVYTPVMSGFDAYYYPGLPIQGRLFIPCYNRNSFQVLTNFRGSGVRWSAQAIFGGLLPG